MCEKYDREAGYMSRDRETSQWMGHERVVIDTPKQVLLELYSVVLLLYNFAPCLKWDCFPPTNNREYSGLGSAYLLSLSSFCGSKSASQPVSIRILIPPSSSSKD